MNWKPVALSIGILAVAGVVAMTGPSNAGSKKTQVATVQQPVANFTAEALMADGTMGTVNFNDDLKGQWNLLFFYPGDGTTVCPTELRAMHAEAETMASMGVNFVPVSVDSAQDHKDWKPVLAEDFDYLWLADEDRLLSRYFNVLSDNNVAMRGAFLIDPTGTLQMAHVNNENVGRNAEDLLRTVEATMTGELCGAEWESGDEYLDMEKDALPIPESDVPTEEGGE